MNLPQIVKNKLLSLGARPDDTFLVALSGGADSTALLLSILEGMGDTAGLFAAHLDHGVRSDSEKDMEKVQAMCGRLGIEAVTGKLDRAELEHLRRELGSLEGAMRALRYRFLIESSRAKGASWIVTGHTSDDQAETVLFRVMRGDNWRSLGGIPERRAKILRPLIEVPRSATWNYCEVRGVIPVTDLSNFDLTFMRNRLRHSILPGLASFFDEDIRDLLQRIGCAARFLASEEKKLLERMLPEPVAASDRSSLGSDLLFSLPRSLQERVILDWVLKAAGVYPSGTLVADVLRFVREGANGTLRLPGKVVLLLSYGQIRIIPEKCLESPTLPVEGYELPVPGTLSIPESGVVISARETFLETTGSYPGGQKALFSRKRLIGPLLVRRRLPGDRLIPLGMSGEKKLKDLFIDRKVPREKRDSIPVVLDQEGDIVWVAGVEISAKGALEGYAGEEAILLQIEQGREEVFRTGEKDGHSSP